jgi:tetratricopeptide (TPR) repeat protein
MKKSILFSLLLLIGFVLNAQLETDTAILNLQNKMEKETDVEKKLNLIAELAAKFNMEKPKECQEVLEKGIYYAESTRDRKLMARSRRNAASLYNQMSGLKEYAALAEKYANAAMEICEKATNLEEEKIAINMVLARIHRSKGNLDQAKKYNETAMELANDFSNDSLKVSTRLSLANTQLAAKSKLDAFRTIYSALNAVDNIPKSNPNKELFMNSVNGGFSNFYSSIEDYDKAIDYMYKMLNYFKKNKKNEEWLSILNGIGQNYFAAKKYDAASGLYNEVIKLADSLKLPNAKLNAEIGIVNVLIENSEKNKSIQYLEQNKSIREAFTKVGMLYQLDYGKALMFTSMDMYDSASLYFKKSIPAIEARSSPAGLTDMYTSYSSFLYKSGNYSTAIQYLNKAKSINDSLKIPTTSNLRIYQYLDSCYRKMNDYKNAMVYNNLASKAKQEIEVENKSKDIVNIQIEAENKRHEKQLALEKITKEKRHSLQYTGIVLGILTLFVSLIMIGFFKLPVKWIKALGFIAFIFLFEFIIFLLDNEIHKITHGEPLYVLLIKVILIALLLPLHHYLEHKVIQYVTKRHSD